LGWPGGIDSASGSVLLLKVSGFEWANLAAAKDAYTLNHQYNNDLAAPEA